MSANEINSFAVRIMAIVWSKLRADLRAFSAARSGNVAVTFAICVLPVVCAVGAAVDYSHANDVKATMQAALDSTALMLSKEAATDSDDELQANALKYFKATFNKPEAKNITISAKYSKATSTVVLNGSLNVATDIMHIIGYRQFTIDATSAATWGTEQMHIALVLDNTGSMRQANKMNSLKAATKALLSQLKSAATKNGDVYVSIIPFAKDVNINSANYTESWLDWTDFDETSGICVSVRNSTRNKSRCISRGGKWIATSHKLWNGCVTDRGESASPSSGDYDTNVVAPTPSIPATLFSPDQYSACPSPVMPLSYDWSAMTTAINNMSPNGTTNQAIGLAHGWMSLVGGGPYPAPPPKDPGAKLKQIIILLTDGMNTEDRWYSNQSSIDARQKMTCDNIKNADISLYTVQVNTGSDPVSTLLQSCASSSGDFYYLTSSSQIMAAFQDIGSKISKLRISN
jgi:Flp pilus assembly protein TadG